MAAITSYAVTEQYSYNLFKRLVFRSGCNPHYGQILATLNPSSYVVMMIDLLKYATTKTIAATAKELIIIDVINNVVVFNVIF